ncbi:uncharacterized protein EAF01_008025 [Botrytis porri]|uniref:uncharacterized protein n=1 Tax=Botrytis porri TaxID=87229 RepID=UPI0018FF3BF2|nr:uncharacterized protein EAF01_008025 [Botrytis porri]KAF7900723.1 hypothetical protein EAF01_008025 [Botrytis porri]
MVALTTSALASQDSTEITTVFKTLPLVSLLITWCFQLHLGDLIIANFHQLSQCRTTAIALTTIMVYPALSATNLLVTGLLSGPIQIVPVWECVNSAIRACCGTSDLIHYPLNDQYNCVIQYCHFPPLNGDDTIMQCLNDVFLSGNSSIQIDFLCTQMDKIESKSPIVRRGTINTILLMTAVNCIWELGSLKRELTNFKRL